jgi:RND family efflux transporter MFP subunit
MNLKQLMLATIPLSMLFTATGCGTNNSGESATVHSVVTAHPVALGASVSKDYSGVVAEQKSISLGFKIAGQILKTCVKEGDYVKAGQLVAMLDDVDYQLAAREAKIQYEQMLAEYNRIEYLYKSNNISQNDYEKSKAGLERLKVNLDNSTNRVKYTKLYAPVSGYVTKLNFEKAEMVNAGSPVIELMDNSALEINVNLPLEAYAKRNQFKAFKAVGQDGKEFAPTLISITPKADNNQLYNMRLAIPATNAKTLTPGMNVNVNIVRTDESVADSTQEYSLPIHAIFYDNNGGAQVWTVAADSTVSAQPVVLGEIIGKGKVKITSGLKGDETIVRAGVNAIKEGEKVKVIAEPKTSNVGSLL